MEIQIEFAEISELINMFNIVVSCITLLPFGMTNYRTKLKRILEEKIDKNKYLQMHFFFFLLSYMESIHVKRLFRKHKIMKKVKIISDFYDYNHNNNNNSLWSDIDNGDDMTPNPQSIESTPFSPYSPTNPQQNKIGHGSKTRMGNNTPYNYNQNTNGNDDENGMNIINPTYNVVDINRLNLNATEDVIYFKEKDPIKLFRAPLDHFAKPGFTVIVPPELQYRFFDPINGNQFVQQLKVCKIRDFEIFTNDFVDCLRIFGLFFVFGEGPICV